MCGRQYSLEQIRALPPEEQNDILGTQAGFGGEKLPAPQASLMAVVARGIVAGKTELILIVVGMFLGVALIMMQVKSPMLISVGMYLPIDQNWFDGLHRQTVYGDITADLRRFCRFKDVKLLYEA